MEQETKAISATLEGFKTLNPKPKPFKSSTLEGLKTVCLRHCTQCVCPCVLTDLSIEEINTQLFPTYS
jgi:hypothetical protein